MILGRNSQIKQTILSAFAGNPRPLRFKIWSHIISQCCRLYTTTPITVCRRRDLLVVRRRGP